MELLVKFLKKLAWGLGMELKTLLLLVLLPLLVATTPLLRKDLQHAGDLLCVKQASVHKAWELRIYDTLLAAEFKTPKPTNLLAKLALEHAQQTTNFGYMYGTCADKRAWLLSVSAPYALQLQTKTGVMKLNPKLKNYCREVGAMFAPSGLQHPTLITINKHTLMLPKNIQTGVLAINCKSLTPARVGPRLLYAVPIGKPSLSAPLLPSATARPERKVIGNWLNKVRKQLRLPAVAIHSYQHGIHDRHSVIHDRVELGRVSKKLQQQQRKFLGENRVRSYSLREALSMLWLSPFHRSLLLHKDAKNIYVRIAKREQQLLLTIIFSS